MPPDTQRLDRIESQHPLATDSSGTVRTGLLLLESNEDTSSVPPVVSSYESLRNVKQVSGSVRATR